MRFIKWNDRIWEIRQHEGDQIQVQAVDGYGTTWIPESTIWEEKLLMADEIFALEHSSPVRPGSDERPMRGAMYDPRMAGWVLVYDGNYLGTYMGGSLAGAKKALSNRSKYYGLRKTDEPMWGEQDRGPIKHALEETKKFQDVRKLLEF